MSDIADYRIVSRPQYIAFECPHCHEEIEIPVDELEGEDLWYLVMVKFPKCGQDVAMGDCEYD